MISTTDSSISYATNGTQVTFQFPYAVIDGDHLTLYLDGTVVASGYSTVLNTDPDTGATVNFNTAPATGQTLEIVRNTPVTQLTDYVGGAKLNPETLENDHDKQILILQEAIRDLGRAVKMPRGSTGNTQLAVGDYGDFVAITAGGDIEGRSGTVGTSDFALADATDVDVITIAAAGTTTITIPDTQTAVFGAVVTVQDDSSAYTHNLDLPAPATTGQRAFIRLVSTTNATTPTVVLRDDGGATLASITVADGNYRTTLEAVSNGSAWLLGRVQYGDTCHDRFTGAAYFVTDSTGLDTAIADANAHIYLYQKVTFDSVLTTEVHRTLASTNRLIVAKGAGFDFGDQRGWSLTIDCEVETAYDDQQIFFNCYPGTVTGSFGGMVRFAEWWLGTGEALLGYSDDWWAIQSAIYAGDWDGTGNTASTITNWNDTTNVITTADQTNFSQGDKIELYTAALGAYLSSRPYICINGTNGTGDTMSTFSLGLFPKHRASVADLSPVVFGTGGSLSATVRKVECASAHAVKLLSEGSYTIDHPLDFGGTGCHLNLNGATITASEDPDSVGSAWISKMVENEAFADGAGQAFTKTDYVSGPNTTDISITTHGYVDGDIVGFSALTTAGNLSTADGYIVNQIDANTFRLQSTVGGSDLDLGDNVVGTVFLKGGHAPMFQLGSAAGESNVWRGVPQKVMNGIASGGGVAGVSIIGAGGTIARRSAVVDLKATLASRSFVGWARDWAAVPGQAASNDFSGLLLRNCHYYQSQKHGGVWPIPAHTPGIDVKVDGLEIKGDTVASGDVPYIWYGGSPRSLVVQGVEYQNSPIFLKFANHGLYKHAVLRDVTEQAGSNSDATSVTSVTIGTETCNATAHPFANGDRLAFEGTGSLPDGLAANKVYFVISKSTNAFKLSLTLGGSAIDLTADNGAFTLHKIGTVVSFESFQRARVYGYNVGTLDDSLLLYDSVLNQNFINGEEDDVNSVAADRRTPLFAVDDRGMLRTDTAVAPTATTPSGLPTGMSYHWIGDDWAGPGNAWLDGVGSLSMAENGNPAVSSNWNSSGLAAIDFDNSGDYFDSSSGLVRGFGEDGASDGWTWVVVHEMDSLTSSTLLDLLGASSHRAMLNGSSGALWGCERRSGTTVNTRTSPEWTPATGTPYITIVRCTAGTTLRLRMAGNGSNQEKDETNDPASTMNDLTTTWSIGTQNAFGTGDYDGRIAEIVLYPSSLADGLLDSAVNYFATRYSITIA